MRTEGSLSELIDVFDTVEEVTGKQPTRWRDYAEKHRDKFLRRVSVPRAR
jgi:hypothetical protein